MKLNEYVKQATIVLDFPYDSDYTTEYLDNMEFVNNHMALKYGQLPIVYNDNANIANAIRGVLFLNKYKYDGLYATTKLTYNPIWNVEGTETTTITHGATETSNIYGDKIHKTSQGEIVYTDTFSEYPYDTKQKTTKNESDHRQLPLITDIKEDGRTDKTNTTEYVDTTVLDRQGNIGVTSTQNLIGQERECVNFVFWDIVIGDVVKEITIPFYEEGV